MSATPQHLAPARRYRIERYLTEGGMGAIFIGKKLGPGGFEKEVVLKQLLPEYTARPEFRDLFFREAKISATLDHANIVHTFDLVESDESLFIVMEYVRGIDLRSIIRRAKLRRRELAPAAALHVTLEVLAGLSYAHTRRAQDGSSLAIIHRDVSPSNILCSAQGEVKLSDFGIAKAATHSSVFYRVRGKVGYMSPEQARGEAIDHRTDLYSVAVCLYEALTMERLFVGDLSTPADVIYSQPIVPPSQKRKTLPRALDVVLATALSPKPSDRYQDAVAFAEALRQVGHRHGLLFSAPQLAEHLRFILGRDSNQWLSDDTVSTTGDPSTQKIPVKEAAKELEGKEAKSIGVVMDNPNLYVVNGSDVMSPAPGKTSTPDARRSSTKLDPQDETTRRMRDPNELDDDYEEETTRRQADPLAAAGADAYVPIHEEPPHRAQVDPGPTPPPPLFASSARPPRRPTPPPPPPVATFPESPFDEEADADAEFPPTPAPVFNGTDFAPPTPAPAAHQQYARPPAYGQGPPPGRPALPSPGGYLDPSYAASLRQPPAPAYGGFTPQAPPLYDPGAYAPQAAAPFAFSAPETVDFSQGSMPLLQKTRSGPPGVLVLIVVLAAAAGGAKLGEIATRADVAALAARSSSSPAASEAATGK